MKIRPSKITHYHARRVGCLDIQHVTGLAISHCPTARGKSNYQSGKWIWTDFSSLFHITVFKIRSETCRTEARFCENLYMIKKESLPNLAGPTQILPVNVRCPALILKTDISRSKNFKILEVGQVMILRKGKPSVKRINFTMQEFVFLSLLWRRFTY